MTTNFRVKMAKSADSPSFIVLAFLSEVEYRNSGFSRFIYDDLATLCKHLVNFGPLTAEFKKGKSVPPRRSAVWLCGATARL